MVAGLAGPAAADAPSAADRVSKALADVGVPLHSGQGPSVAGDSKVDIDPSRPAVSVATGGKTLSVSLVTPSGRTGEAVGDARAFGDVARDTDVVTRQAESGAQILAVMRTASAPTTQQYKIIIPAGTRLEPFGQAYNLVEADGKVIGQIAAPWAKDASGRSLPTAYTLDGTTLTQRTDTAGAQFPVVADPRITIGRGIYLNMWGYEVRAAAIAIIAAGGVSFVVACTAISRVPSGILRTLATLICGAASVNLTKVWQAIVDTYYSSAWVDGACYQQKIAPMENMRRVGTSNC